MKMFISDPGWSDRKSKQLKCDSRKLRCTSSQAKPHADLSTLHPAKSNAEEPCIIEIAQVYHEQNAIQSQIRGVTKHSPFSSTQRRLVCKARANSLEASLRSFFLRVSSSFDATSANNASSSR